MSSPTRARSTLIPSTKQQSDITYFYTVRKQLPTLNTRISTMDGDLSFFWECRDPEETLESVRLLLVKRLVTAGKFL